MGLVAASARCRRAASSRALVIGASGSACARRPGRLPDRPPPVSAPARECRRCRARAAARRRVRGDCAVRRGVRAAAGASPSPFVSSAASPAGPAPLAGFAPPPPSASSCSPVRNRRTPRSTPPSHRARSAGRRHGLRRRAAPRRRRRRLRPLPPPPGSPSARRLLGVAPAASTRGCLGCRPRLAVLVSSSSSSSSTGAAVGGCCAQRPGLLEAVHLLALLDHEGHLAADGRIGVDQDDDAEALLQRAQVGALLVEQIERDLGARAHHEIVGRALEQHFLERAQQLQRDRRHRAHVAGAAAMRAFLGRAFQHARADALARHFQQAEMRDVTDLDARAVVPQAFLEPALDRAVVALLVHVDEVDDDQAGEVAQAQLPRDLLGGLQVGLERGVLDVVLARGAARVDVDRDQRLGLVEHDVAAGAQLHHRRRTWRRAGSRCRSG